MKTVLKFLGALVGLVVLLVAALAVFVLLTLKPNLPGSEFALQPVPAGAPLKNPPKPPVWQFAQAASKTA